MTSLQTSLSGAQQKVSELEQQLSAETETHQATLQALEKQAEALKVWLFVGFTQISHVRYKTAYFALEHHQYAVFIMQKLI